MLDFPRWKMWLVILPIIACILLSIPSMVPEATRAKLPAWVPQPTVNLGLDLAGGSYILLEGQTDAVLKKKLDEGADAVSHAASGKPAISIGDVSKRDGAVSFLVRDPAQIDLMRQRLLNAGIGGTGVGALGSAQEWSVEVRDSSRFVLTPTKAGLDGAVNRAMDDATEVVRKRIDELGTREPTIIRQGASRIVVQVPGLGNPQALIDLLGRTASLSFQMVDETADPGEVAAGRAPIGDVILPYPAMGNGAKIALNRRAIITGDQLVDARQSFDQQTGQPIVSMRFNTVGGKAFARVTSQNVGKKFAIVVDDIVISAPVIQSEILGGTGQIQGSFTVDSANQLAIALRSGKLPIPLQVVDQSTISAELGKDSIQKGGVAAIVGTVLVIALMLFTYLRFGVYATIALIVNILMILGIMALIGATLTLPGIAGFVLTIGAAVDANVLINERIREEQRRGRTVRQAIEVGYKEASRAIFDSNLTNVIAAAIMFIVGSGPVRGFAVVLTIGIVTSVFTAVMFTALLVHNWLKTRPKTLVI